MNQWTEQKDQQAARQVLSVSQITDEVKRLIEGVFDNVWVSGEVSNLTLPQSGHAYFTLKDDYSQLRSVIWRRSMEQMKFDLKNGMEIICFGNLDLYGPRGTYQLSVRTAEPKGVGAMQLAFQQLHDRLKAKGYFAPEQKKPLPKFPKRIAIVTSPTGAAIRDFMQVLNRRWKGLELLVIPARVQGEGSVQEIVRGIQHANQLRDTPDVLVIGRGGGSMEDLWSFNDEAVVQAIFQSEIPVVSAVGHEIDVTLSDLSADLRALTPSEAAERIVPSMEDYTAKLKQYQQRMRHLLAGRVDLAKRKLEMLARSRVLANPMEIIDLHARLVDEKSLQMRRLIDSKLRLARNTVDIAAGQLHSISPLSVLSRGYSITSLNQQNQPLLGNEQLAVGEELKTQLHHGTIISRIINAKKAVE